MAKRDKQPKGQPQTSRVEVGSNSQSHASNSGVEQPQTEQQAQEQTGSAISFSVQETRTLDDEKRRKRLESAARWRAKKRLEAVNGGEADSVPDALTVAAFLTVIESLVVAWAGPSAVMLPHERELIEKPALRMLARMDEGTREAVNQWADPIALITGLTMFGMRALSVRKDALEAASEFERVAQPKPQSESVPAVNISPAPSREPSILDSIPSPRIDELMSMEQ